MNAPGHGAELAARITVAKAVSDDFKREREAYINHGAARPHYNLLAFRLSSVLDLLLAELAHARTKPEPCPECARDLSAEQHQTGCPVWDAGGPGGARQLAEVRAVLAAFDWEHDDRQYALEHIERIVTRGDR